MHARSCEKQKRWSITWVVFECAGLKPMDYKSTCGRAWGLNLFPTFVSWVGGRPCAKRGYAMMACVLIGIYWN